MQRRRFLSAACLLVPVVAALGLSFASAAGQERPELVWPQFQQGPSHGGFLSEGPQPPYRIRWTLTPPSGGGLSTPIVVGDVAIGVGSDAVYGIDLSTGDVAWQIPRDGGPRSAPAAARVEGRDVLLYLEGPSATLSPTPSVTPPPSPTDGPTTSPTALADDAPLVSSLVAVDLADRSELWRSSLSAPSRSGVTVDGEVAYVGDRDGTVFAFGLTDGEQIWSAEVPGRVDIPVAVDDSAVYAVVRDTEDARVSILGLEAASGERRWGVAIQTSSTAGSAPALGTSGVIVGSADRIVRALGVDDGEQRWSSLVLSLFSPATSPAVTSEAVFAADVSGGLYRLDERDGRRSWSYQFNEVVIRSAPVVSGSTVLLGLDDGRLVAVDAARGRLTWQSEPSAGALGTIAVSSEAIVAVRTGGTEGLIAFEHDPDGALIDEPSPTELAPGQTFGRYVAAAAMVFVLAFVPGVLLARRMGPAKLEPDTDEEPVTDDDDDGVDPGDPA